MALCKVLKKLAFACAAVHGGIARIWAFDPEDMDFTQAAPVAGVVQPYSAIALTNAAATGGAGSTPVAGANVFPLEFEDKQAKYTAKQSSPRTASKWEHQLQFYHPGIRQALTDWNLNVDEAGNCCGIGLIILLNSGKFLVIGEKYVNGAEVDIPMKIKQDGSSQDSGNVFDDPNGQDTILKGDYYRPAFEYTGGLAALTALEP